VDGYTIAALSDLAQRSEQMPLGGPGH
jgi:hypothetical protein